MKTWVLFILYLAVIAVVTGHVTVQSHWALGAVVGCGLILISQIGWEAAKS